MADTLKELFQNTADAIRTVNQLTDTYKPIEFPDAIKNLGTSMTINGSDLGLAAWATFLTKDGKNFITADEGTTYFAVVSSGFIQITTSVPSEKVVFKVTAVGASDLSSQATWYPVYGDGERESSPYYVSAGESVTKTITHSYETPGTYNLYFSVSDRGYVTIYISQFYAVPVRE